MFRLTGSTQQQIERLAQTFSLQLVALTRGPAGSLLFQGGDWSDCPSVPIKVVDTVGAGDAFTAALVLGLLQKMDLDEDQHVLPMRSPAMSVPVPGPRRPCQQRFSLTSFSPRNIALKKTPAISGLSESKT